MTTKAQLAIGLDLGATKIEAALATRQGNVIATERRATTPTEGVEAVLINLTATINNLLQQAPEPVAGIGIGAPGQVEPATGTVRNAVNLNWHEVALVQEIQNRLEMDLPVYVQKDANAEVLGEAYFGAGQGCKNLVYMGIGSGLGGGAIVNGQLVIGDTFNASEIGHLSLDLTGRVCQCGSRGCAETVVSGPGIVAMTRDYLAQQNYDTGLIDTPALTPKDVVSAAFNGDPLALAVFAEVARWLGTIMAAYVAILNPARMVVGGGVGRAAFDLLLPHLKVEIQQRVLKVSCQHLEIARSQLASSAVGASGLVWHK